jgi:hypothetical protein
VSLAPEQVAALRHYYDTTDTSDTMGEGQWEGPRPAGTADLAEGTGIPTVRYEDNDSTEETS